VECRLWNPQVTPCLAPQPGVVVNRDVDVSRNRRTVEIVSHARARLAHARTRSESIACTGITIPIPHQIARARKRTRGGVFCQRVLSPRPTCVRSPFPVTRYLFSFTCHFTPLLGLLPRHGANIISQSRVTTKFRSLTLPKKH